MNVCISKYTEKMMYFNYIKYDGTSEVAVYIFDILYKDIQSKFKDVSIDIKKSKESVTYYADTFAHNGIGESSLTIKIGEYFLFNLNKDELLVYHIVNEETFLKYFQIYKNSPIAESILIYFLPAMPNYLFIEAFSKYNNKLVILNNDFLYKYCSYGKANSYTRIYNQCLMSTLPNITNDTSNYELKTILTNICNFSYLYNFKVINKTNVELKIDFKNKKE